MIDPALLEAFENRVRKRYRHLRKWAQRERCTAFRVYDRDIPEMACAFDVYGERALLQQYLRGPEIPAEHDVLEAVAAAAARATDRAPEAVTLKVRRKLDRREMQHQPTGWEGADFVVEEHGLKFVVNLEAYLDTGLFLDHRPTRALVRACAAGRRLLNLFCYTGSFTVHAAAGGAEGSISVDLSNTYLAWARRNLELNGIDLARHRLERADVREWLREARGRGERFGLVVLDPPAYSSSKRMDGVFDVQRDHGGLIADTAALLEPGGELYFSTNLRGFRLDGTACAGLAVEDITARTIPEDFRNQRIHQCWRMTRRVAA
jgi:23S rRNA (cytosine1962-C5)-methyltransferase